MSGFENWSEDFDWQDDLEPIVFTPEEISIASLAYFLSRFGKGLVIGDMTDPQSRKFVDDLKAAGAQLIVPADN